MTYDLIIITAANKAQAAGYQQQLKGRANIRVVPDPGDKRVGSLGATVNVLRSLVPSKKLQRVLICHSGGDSKRMPAYAAMGKAFVPMRDGRPMLDHIIAAMERLPAKPGVTVCCGDVIPYLDYSQVSFAPIGVTGVAYPDVAWQAQRHGVYVTDGRGVRVAEYGHLTSVSQFLQKPKVTSGRHLIDTGILFFDWKTAEKMKKFPISGDIYEDFPALLIAGFAPFNVSIVPRCKFFHIGSSRELLKLLGTDGKLVDGVHAPIRSLGGDNIVTNVPSSYGPITLAKGECLTSLPIDKKTWYHLKYNIDDNFKTDGLWEKYDLGSKMKRIDHARLMTVRMPRAVRVTAPARIDLAGGWSDTPPICQKEGGVVLAAAVTIDGKRPIEVTVAPRKDKLVKVVSKDLGKQAILRTNAEIADHHDPNDWCCLVKSALAVTGFRFGLYGLDIVISSALPKGSGLGTSSILGAATIAALLGECNVAKVGALTLALEHEMCTGGGWEDQFAGMTPGLKIIRTQPGVKQTIEICPVVPKANLAADLKKRSLLYFTGQKRMARNILRRVIRFYEENPHGFGKILIDSLKDSAARGSRALKMGNFNAFAACVNEYWRDKKLLDAGSTNEKVDDIVDAIRPHVAAVSLAGAGGGGFMYILAKTPADAKQIRKMLEANPPCPEARFYDFAIDMRGLVIEDLPGRLAD